MSLPPLVHLVPVLSSTASLTLALTEYQSLLPWLTLHPPPKHLSAWFDRWFRLGLAGVLVLGVTSTYGGYAACKGTLVSARTLYTYGIWFALAYLAFAQPIYH